MEPKRYYVSATRPSTGGRCRERGTLSPFLSGASDPATIQNLQICEGSPSEPRDVRGHKSQVSPADEGRLPLVEIRLHNPNVQLIKESPLVAKKPLPGLTPTTRPLATTTARTRTRATVQLQGSPEPLGPRAAIDQPSGGQQGEDHRATFPRALEAAEQPCLVSDLNDNTNIVMASIAPDLWGRVLQVTKSKEGKASKVELRQMIATYQQRVKKKRWATRSY